MNDRRAMGPDAPDDSDLAELVRALAEDWKMPPQRLGEPTWRDRVRPGRMGGAGPSLRWAGRVTRAAGIAVAATVVLALAAVWLTLPRIYPGGPPPPASGGPVRPSAGAPTMSPSTGSSSAGQTPLPAIARFGALPTPSRIVVGTGTAYAVLDLATGMLGPSFAGWSDAYSPLLALPDGGYLSLSVATVTTATTDGLRVGLRFYDAEGSLTSSLPLRAAGIGSPGAPSGTAGEFIGRTDPAAGVSTSDQGSSAAIDGSVSPDGRYLYLGWAVRQPPAWRIGVDVVDLSDGSVVEAVRLPDVPSSQSGGIVYAWAPHVLVAPDARHAVIRGTTVENAQGTDGWWSAPLVGGRLGAPAPPATGTGTLDQCREATVVEGFAASSTYYALCGTNGAPVVLRRVDLAGRPAGDTALPGLVGGQLPGETAVAVDRAHGTLYAWGPFTGTLVRVDLPTGRVSRNVTVPQPTAVSGGPPGLLGTLGAGLGRWLAPGAAAKVYLQPAIALSADGSRIYALGVNGTSALDASAGSSGVWVFDTSTMRVAGHWAPTADFASIAVSPDGRSVYAAGMSGVDASGSQRPLQASVTVYDASDGSVRVIAGALGDAFLDVAPGTSMSYP